VRIKPLFDFRTKSFLKEIFLKSYCFPKKRYFLFRVLFLSDYSGSGTIISISEI
jgi:hypothetical protein